MGALEEGEEEKGSRLGLLVNLGASQHHLSNVPLHLGTASLFQMQQVNPICYFLMFPESAL